VLGSIRSSGKSSGSWQWAAGGKHPVVKDYFEVGSGVPVLKAFLGWMEKGYGAASSKGPPAMGFCSWRFWARGSGRQSLVCGLCKDSSDGLGRRFPLLISGTGLLGDWQNAWELLPLACEKVWSQMENLSATRFSGFDQFETRVGQLSAPSGDWSVLNEHMAMAASQCSSLPDNDTVSRCQRSFDDARQPLADAQVVFCALDAWSLEDISVVSSRLHNLLKQHNPDAPNAVFIGGNIERTFLAVFRRALAPLDFVRLWAQEPGVEKNGNEPFYSAEVTG
jgi:type VI secretion system protein VasJ